MNWRTELIENDNLEIEREGDRKGLGRFNILTVK